LSRDDASDLSVSRVHNWDVSHVEFSHIVNALADVIGRHHHHRVLYQVRSQVDHGILVVLTDLLVFISDWEVLAPEIPGEVSPVQNLLIGRWWIKLNVKVAGEVFRNLLLIRVNRSPFVIKLLEPSLCRPGRVRR